MQAYELYDLTKPIYNIIIMFARPINYQNNENVMLCSKNTVKRELHRLVEKKKTGKNNNI